MPSIDVDFLTQLRVDIAQYPVFVEGGTYHGDTIFAMEPHFRELHTVEVNPKLYQHTKSNYDGAKIQFHCGDTVDVFPVLLEKLHQNIIFFLDSHWSRSMPDTSYGSKYVPLLEELDIIMRKCSNRCVVIIDDYRLFGASHGGWNSIHKGDVMKIVSSRFIDDQILPSDCNIEDRWVIYLLPLEHS